MPLVCVLYVLSYLDRGNIANAKTAGAQDDLGLSDSQVQEKSDATMAWERLTFAVGLGSELVLHLLHALRVDDSAVEASPGTSIHLDSLSSVSL